MALPRARSGEPVALSPLGPALPAARTTAVLKGRQLEIVRLVLRAGEGLREHSAPGEVTVHVIEGEIDFQVPGGTHRLRAGDFIHLEAGQPHALQARVDSSAVVTIALGAPAGPQPL